MHSVRCGHRLQWRGGVSVPYRLPGALSPDLRHLRVLRLCRIPVCPRCHLGKWCLFVLLNASSQGKAGFQIYFGGYFISIILRCIFSSFNNMKNTIPLSQNVTT